MTRLKRLRTPVLLLLIPMFLPGLIVVPALLKSANNSIGIDIRQDKPTSPVYITFVAPSSPAENADLKPGMRLIGAMGKPINTLEDVGTIWEQRAPDELLTVQVQHGKDPPRELHIKPGINPDFTPLLLNILGGFFFLSLITLLLPHWKNAQASVLILMLMLLSTDFILPYGYGGQWDAWLWRFNLFNLIGVNLLALHFFFLFPKPIPAYRNYRHLILTVLYGILLPTGFFLAAQVEDPSNNQSSFPVYTMDATLALASWTLLSYRTWSVQEAATRAVARWVWVFFTPFAFAKLLWNLQTYGGIEVAFSIDSLVQAATILAPTGIFLAVLRMDYLQAGRRIRDHDLGQFLTIILLLLGLILAQQVFFLMLDMEPALAPLATAVSALILGALAPVISGPLRNWVVRGIFARPDHFRRATEYFFIQHGQKRNETGLLEEACQFLKEQLRVPWAGIHYRNGADEDSEIITLSQPAPFPPSEIPAFLAGLEIFSKQYDKATSKEQRKEKWMQHFSISNILPLLNRPTINGQIMLGNRGHPLSSHEYRDLQKFLQRLIPLLERIQLEKIAKVDSLTGVLRREAGLARLQQELDLAHSRQRPLSLVLLDLDHFKQVNDTLGHPVGDLVLKETAKQLRHCLRQSDFICRYGGEEFLLILPGTHLDGACIALSKLLRAVNSHYINYGKGDKNLYITVSAGCSVLEDFTRRGSPPDRLASRMIEHADRLLYQAKKSGRNRYFCKPL